MPVRKVPKSYRNVTGIAAHKKAIGRAEYESTLERDFLTLLAFDPNVVRFEVQPVMIVWEDGKGQQRRYTPDTLVHYSDKTILYEVKQRKELRRKWAELRPKFKAAIRYASAKGWRFKLITDTEIRTPFLWNATFLMPHLRKEAPTKTDTDLLLGKLEELGTSTPQALLESISDDIWRRAELLPALWFLVGARKVGADLNRQLTQLSPIWLPI